MWLVAVMTFAMVILLSPSGAVSVKWLPTFISTSVYAFGTTLLMITAGWAPSILSASFKIDFTGTTSMVFTSSWVLFGSGLTSGIYSSLLRNMTVNSMWMAIFSTARIFSPVIA